MPGRAAFLPRLGFVSLFVLTVAGCSSGSSTDPDGRGSADTRAATVTILTAPDPIVEVAAAFIRQPVVRVTDEGGNPVAVGTAVSAAVTVGNGIVLSGGAASTNADGTAAFAGLTLGALNGAAGEIRLEFRASGGASASVDMQLWCVLRLLELDVPEAGSLRVGDCAFEDGALFHNYVLEGTAPLNPVRLTLEAIYPSPGLYYLFLEDESFTWFFGDNAVGSEPVVRFTFFVPEGDVLVRPSSLAAGVTGSYTLTAAVADEDVTGCDAPWIVGSLATSQTLAVTDCTEDGSLYWDDYLFGLSPGGNVEATMTSEAFTPRIVLWEGTATGVSLVADEVGAGIQVSVSHTAPAESGRTYLLELLSEEGGATGAYSVTREIAGPAVTAVAPAAGTEPFVGERHGSDGGFGWPAPRSNARGPEWRSVTPPRPASPRR